jgi:hypothetical protein
MIARWYPSMMGSVVVRWSLYDRIGRIVMGHHASLRGPLKRFEDNCSFSNFAVFSWLRCITLYNTQSIYVINCTGSGSGPLTIVINIHYLEADR